MTPIFWMHFDAITAPPVMPAHYIFDPLQLDRDAWSLKRVQFVYECLLEVPVTIHKGDTVGLLTHLAAGGPIVTFDTPEPWLRQCMQALRARGPVEILAPEPFVNLRGPVDLRRFSRYWRKAEPLLL
jgi:deoxyribodipyrimidine photo-lyase